MTKTQTTTCPRCQTELPPNSPAGICPKCLLAAGLEDRSGAEHPSRASLAGLLFVPPAPAELAKHFPNLEINELIGKGGMGAVYQARQPHLDRLVAVKILPPEVGQDPAFAQRFAREARALAKLNHPNIVSVFDFGRAGEYFYFLMEFVDGANLRTLIQNGKLQPQEALAIVPQICEALQFAHDEGIVHRDIKPENILVDKRGRVKIADFGLAKLLGGASVASNLTGTHQVMGTMHYMAPEQFQGSRGVDHRADIYSLGVVFYEMLTGNLPLGRFDPPSRKAPVDARLDQVVMRSLEAEPDRRYQHASEVRSDLQTLAPPVAEPPPIVSYDDYNSMYSASPSREFFPPADEQMRRRLGPAAVALLVAAALDMLGFIFFCIAALEDVGPRTSLVAFLLMSIFCIRSSFCVIIATGAAHVRHLRYHTFARTACTLALLPFSTGWPVAIIPAIWLLWRLRQPEVVDAFERYAAKRDRYQPAWGFTVATLVPVFVLLAVLGLFVLRSSQSSNSHAFTDSIDTLPPAVPDSKWIDWTEGSPRMTSMTASALGLHPELEMRLNDILRQTYDQYLALESQHRRSVMENGKLKVNVEPFSIEGLESDFWDSVDPALVDNGQRRQARNVLRPILHTEIYRFHRSLELSIWRSGTFYVWTYKYSIPVNGFSSTNYARVETNGEDAELPQAIARFWEEGPTTQATSAPQTEPSPR